MNDASKVVYLLDATGTYLPYWSNSSGFIELQAARTAQAAARTVDFVRFGESTTEPLTRNYWVGANVPAFATPAATYVGSQSLDPLDTHDQSIARLNSRFTATGTSTDWTLVDFPTPGGPNDVAAGVTDSDHDGIPDTAKAAGGTYAGLDLYAMGARPGQKDMFIQLDYMGSDASATTQDSARQLQEATLTKMAAAFAPHHIVVHFDAGTRFSAKVDTAHYNLDGASHERTFGKCTQMSASATESRTALENGCTSIYRYYSQHVDPRRRAFFRYGLLASSQNSDGSSGSSGISELPGNKVLVTLKGFLANNLSAAGETMRVNFQAATLMHEFGHSLGLRHGGDELAVNYKPNYLSIMNYLYQLSGVPTDGTGTDAVERYYYHQNDWNGVAVPNTRLPSAPYAAYTYPADAVPHGPTSDTFKIDYSDGSSLNLDENALKESDYVGRGAGTSATAFGDWNLNGVKQAAPYQLSLTGQLDTFGRTVYVSLHDFNDWNHLALVTGKNYNLVGIAQSYGIGTDHPPLIKTSRIQTEEAVPAAVLAHLKQVSAR
ncbi:hypothetical protein AB3X96_41745 [Paraburkholderia sp. BR13439]|uniref:hypothetical protein n=1 Tax=unclassified Paraburkholderia TaxID=2615204 RepID=UPI0034CF2B61